MSFIEWDNSWEIGVDEIDIQHRRFVEILNELFSNIEDCQDLHFERNLANKSLIELVDYASFHFDSEEKLMLSCDYSDLKNHIAQHDEFKEKLSEIAQRYKTGEFLLTLDIFYFMKQWLYDHIKGCDSKYVGELK